MNGTTNQPNLLELASQGNAQAIATLMNRQLQPKGITTKAALKEGCLQIMLESAQVPNQQALVVFIRKGITNLGAEPIKKVKVYGRQIGEEFPAWNEEFEVVAQTVQSLVELTKHGDVNAINTLIEEQVNSPLPTPEVAVAVQSSSSSSVTQSNSQLAPQKPSMWGSLFGAVAGAAGAVGGAAVSAGGAVVGTAGAVGGTAVSAGGAVAGAVAGATIAVGGAAVTAGQAVAGAAVGVGGAIGSAAMQAPQGLGYVLNVVGDSPMLQELTKALKVDWLLKLIDQVDIVKAETQVKRLQQKYPNEKPSDITHRLMLEKSLYVGGSGFASSLVPGFATALLAVDLATSTALQAEMIYQIACAYGFDLKEPARKGEVVAIFGLSLGGGQALKAGSSYAVKAGLGFLRNVPVAGAAIGASTNAVMLYAVGYAACRFYEAKLNPLTMEATLEASQSESEKYLESAIAQEVTMDQILVHIVLAGNPGKTWEQILPELQALNLSPTSLNAIAANIQSPLPLETLLGQINSDFAIPLLAQCHRIAQLDEVITPEEAKVIETITKKFDLKLDAFKELSVG
jgi:uncharacterized protein (DUF697 family)